eukprot:13853147-Heterocapsa_arctica.AAC.1
METATAKAAATEKRRRPSSWTSGIGSGWTTRGRLRPPRRRLRTRPPRITKRRQPKLRTWPSPFC